VLLAWGMALCVVGVKAVTIIIGTGHRFILIWWDAASKASTVLATVLSTPILRYTLEVVASTFEVLVLLLQFMFPLFQFTDPVPQLVLLVTPSNGVGVLASGLTKPRTSHWWLLGSKLDHVAVASGADVPAEIGPVTAWMFR
jgi:hypothetical protein